MTGRAVDLERSQRLLECRCEVACLVVDHTEQVMRPRKRQGRLAVGGDLDSFGGESKGVIGVPALMRDRCEGIERLGFVVDEFGCPSNGARFQGKLAGPDRVVDTTQRCVVQQLSHLGVFGGHRLVHYFPFPMRRLAAFLLREV